MYITRITTERVIGIMKLFLTETKKQRLQAATAKNMSNFIN